MNDRNDRTSPRFDENPVGWHDITASLVWPLMLRAPAAAFNPSRLVLGTLGAFLLALWFQIHQLITNPDQAASGADELEVSARITLNAATRLDLGDMLLGVLAMIELLIERFMAQPWSSLLLVAPALLILSLIVHAVARSSAVEHATGRHTETVDALTHACRSIRQITLATLGPLVIVALSALVILAAGFTLGIPILDLLGGVLYAISLVLAVLSVSIIVVHIAALPMTVAALAIEDTDGFDALQRGFAYVLARPARLALYAGIAFITGALVSSILFMISKHSVNLTDTLSGALTNDAGRRILGSGEDLGATAPTTRGMIELWRSVLHLLVAGYIVSFISCASSTMYLCMRRVCDGQDTTDIWDPEPEPPSTPSAEEPTIG